MMAPFHERIFCSVGRGGGRGAVLKIVGALSKKIQPLKYLNSGVGWGEEGGVVGVSKILGWLK